MLIAGEKLNSSIPAIQKAVRDRDAASILEAARLQLECGADCLDINAGVFLEEEGDALEWLITTIQSQLKARIMVDSTNPPAIERALAADAVHDAILNSITLEEKRFNSMVPLAIRFSAGIVALPIEEGHIPHTAQERMTLAEKLLDRLTQAGMTQEKIYLDPLVMAASTEGTSAKATLETIRLMKEQFPGVHVIGGISNISYGLPERKLVNRTFLSAAICAGLDAAILDITDMLMKETLLAALALSGEDEYCLDYIRYFREKKR